MESAKTDIFTMPLHEDRNVGPASVMRVPGGWIYTNAIGGMAFVPWSPISKAYEMRAALEQAREWGGLGMDANEHFEAMGAMFYRETGFIRPGKDDPSDSHFAGEVRENERKKYWDDWYRKKSKEIAGRILAALAPEGQ